MATEKRLIDANALSESISGIGKNMTRPRAVELACLVMISEAPTVDAVEAVRCKDCKRWHEETGFCDKHSRFDSFGMDWNMFAEDDFCSYGERKSDG